MKTSGPILLYRGAARLIGPALTSWLLRRRAARGKEVAARLGERFGRASAPRPEGDVVWLHAASVGESMSLLPLIEALTAERPSLHVVLTTGTRTSAEMMAERLPEGAVHQFAPVDTPQAVGAFLDHWRPSLYAVVESEIWPTALGETTARGVRTALLSARLSSKTARGWSFAPRSIAALLDAFDVILAQNETVADRLRRLGAPDERLSVAGSLKDAAPALPVDQSEFDYWRMQLAGRIVWLAASTHDGEEQIVFAAQKQIAAARAGALVVVAPRHPERAAEVARAAEAAGHSVALRSGERPPDAKHAVLIVDRLGELGLWYRLARAAFIGGSIAPVGGHNPLEPARLGVAMVYGPATENCQDECLRLEEAGGAARIAPTAPALAAAILELVGLDGRPTEVARGRSAAALRAAEAGGQSLTRHLAAVLALIDREKTKDTGDAAA